jgi:hypothetical protein
MALGDAAMRRVSAELMPSMGHCGVHLHTGIGFGDWVPMTAFVMLLLQMLLLLLLQMLLLLPPPPHTITTAPTTSPPAAPRCCSSLPARHSPSLLLFLTRATQGRAIAVCSSAVGLTLNALLIAAIGNLQNSSEQEKGVRRVWQRRLQNCHWLAPRAASLKLIVLQILREIRMQHHKKLAPEEAARFIQSWFVSRKSARNAPNEKRCRAAASPSNVCPPCTPTFDRYCERKGWRGNARRSSRARWINFMKSRPPPEVRRVAADAAVARRNITRSFQLVSRTDVLQAKLAERQV